MKYRYDLPAPGDVRMTECQKYYIDFITSEQLLREDLWRLFVSAYENKSDDVDLGWRGEYWGKMMRGACLVYRCTKDAKLYDVLRGTVLELLAAAEPDGRISSYSRGKQFSGWDLWCRKYVLTGMLHFCDICTDPGLVYRILSAMEKHAERVIDGVGDGEGQIPITETSDFWLGVNSCTILEPVLDLYRRTSSGKLLRFAEYIIGTGGCSGDGDLIELALGNEISPWQYPENKAYETMSFFEGVLAYYEITGEKKYYDAVRRFVRRVSQTEITLIGCAGCTHELFDNAAVRQTEKSGKAMQETCVTVTWMRLCARLFLLTGDTHYADEVERSALNALYGSVNIYRQPVTDPGNGEKLYGMPFDSYSPLYMSRRDLGVGGLKFFPDRTFYGCCACIGAAGLAVFPLIDSLRTDSRPEYRLKEHHLNGKIAFTYGPYTLCRDSDKEGADITGRVRPLRKDAKLVYSMEPREDRERVRIRLKTAGGSVLLTDYASCGKRWAGSDGIMTVWMDT